MARGAEVGFMGSRTDDFVLEKGFVRLPYAERPPTHRLCFGLFVDGVDRRHEHALEPLVTGPPVMGIAGMAVGPSGEIQPQLRGCGGRIAKRAESDVMLTQGSSDVVWLHNGIVLERREDTFRPLPPDDVAGPSDVGTGAMSTIPADRIVRSGFDRLRRRLVAIQDPRLKHRACLAVVRRRLQASQRDHDGLTIQK